ncbi:MAG: hypothetical protein IT378_10000, partial [Sandaracinaceae bacterium]|nr:hypothetical protein [Sandaracinaceae bacterium]
VLDAFEHVRSLVYFGDRLRYRAISELHEQQIAPVRDRLPTVTAEQVFAGVRYQPLTQGFAFGTLRIVRGRLDASTVRPDQVLVLEQLPDEIPVPSAVITAQLQAPLGHIALLCANRGTPNMGLRDALSSERIVSLDGRLVRLEIGMQDYVLREASREEAETAWAARRPAQPLVPRIDPSRRELTDVCDLRLASSDFAGAKASQLGEVCAIGPPIRTPGGFVVPFAHYLAHLERTGLATGIAGMLADQAFRSQAQLRAQRLAELRAMIERSPVDPALVRELRARIRRFPSSSRVILRSSTNAEDLPGFTGAGLYRSIVVAANAGEAELTRALREVWSSVWLLGAYEEREWYRVDHASVAMAVLVQPFVDGAIANGVALTNNPYFEGRPAYFVNAQALGGSVTGATGDEIPEQYLIYTYSEDLEMELLTRSSRTGGQTLLREAELRELAEALTLLHTRLRPQWGPRANAADVEFLVAGPDRHVIILQARPFTVAWNDAQR